MEVVLAMVESSPILSRGRDREALQRLYGLLMAAPIPVTMALSFAFALKIVGKTSLYTVASVPMVAVCVAGTYFSYRSGLAFIRLYSPPIYPRECYYGRADLAPEEPGRDTTERFWMMFGVFVVLLPLLVVSMFLEALQFGPVVGLVAGLLPAAHRARLSLQTGAAQDLELRMRGRYLLYLRSFGQSRVSATLATLAAAWPQPVLMIVSPRRLESRVLVWYFLSVCRPRIFDRLHLWSTIDAEWDRVVASCMARSWAIVIDCVGIGPTFVGGPGLAIEAGVSVGFAKDHPTAYILGAGQVLPSGYPIPAQVRVPSGFWWILRHYGPLVKRIRDVVQRKLPRAEQDYIDTHYSQRARGYDDAVIRDRNKALREGRTDPAQELLARRSGLVELERRLGQRSSAISERGAEDGPPET